MHAILNLQVGFSYLQLIIVLFFLVTHLLCPISALWILPSPKFSLSLTLVHTTKEHSKCFSSFLVIVHVVDIHHVIFQIKTLFYFIFFHYVCVYTICEVALHIFPSLFSHLPISIFTTFTSHLWPCHTESCESLSFPSTYQLIICLGL